MFWSPKLASDTLTLARLPPALAGSQSPLDLPPPEAEVVAPDGVHILLDPGLAAQLWLLGPPPTGTAIGLLLPLDESLPVRLTAALDLWRRMHGRPAEPVTIPPLRRRRLVDGLRALDARMAGASYREIARALFGIERVPSGAAWKSHDLRSRTLRLVADATALMRGGYRDLLRPRSPPR